MLIPLKVYVPMDRTPWANYALMGLISAVSIYGFSNIDFIIEMAGGSIASGFVHAGWLHLAGNMLFLWVFGNAVNYKFGQFAYLGLYLVSALAGGMAHSVFVGGSAIGASDAINGIMGAFLVYFPRNDVTVFWVLWYRPGISTLSSGWIILFWLAWDVLYIALGAQTGVALWAHVGGFVAGFAIATVCTLSGWVRPTQDEQTLYQVLSGRT